MTESSSPLRILVVGGVAGGASAAARARRQDEFAEITILERGPDVSFANCGLPYHIGGEIKDRDKLAVQTPASLTKLLNLTVRSRTEAISINREEKTLKVKQLDSGEEEDLAYDKLILSPGASPLTPPLPGIDLPGIYTLRNLQDMDHIKDAVSAAKKTLVIGAGFIGLEMAEQLRHLYKDVTLVELADQVLPQMDQEMVKPMEQDLRDHQVDLILGDGIASFATADTAGLTATLNSGKTLDADLIILSIGVRPESTLAKEAGLELGERGHIRSNEYLQTSDPDIYAVGDVCETKDPVLGGYAAVPLGGPANRQGRIAADHIVLGEKARPYPGSIGTAIVRAFNTAAGVVGASEKRLKQMGIEYEKTVVTDYHHASYYPGAVHVSVKILWDKETGRLLGGQASGAQGVDKRLDVLATAIRAEMTVEDLENLELSYAPPFGSAKDPVNTAGFSATNIRHGGCKATFGLPEDPNVQLVDVRPPEMVELNPIEGAVNIPYAQMRSRLDELDKTRPVVTVCALGKTSYFASRILRQHGFDVSTHVGGLRLERPPSFAPPPQAPVPPGEPRDPDQRLDATGLACPGPIVKMKGAAQNLAAGQTLEVIASDPGFARDFPAFCEANGYECLSVEKTGGAIVGVLRKPDTTLRGATAQVPSTAPSNQDATLVVFSQEMDKVMAGLVIANGALAMGGQATLFFTFWGLNALRDPKKGPVKGKTVMDKMFGIMLPKGTPALPLSNMHFAGMGKKMMVDRMASKDLPNVNGLLQDALAGGARLVACSMSMDAMGIRKEELIDGVEVGGVAEFLGASSKSGTQLFI